MRPPPFPCSSRADSHFTHGHHSASEGFLGTEVSLAAIFVLPSFAVAIAFSLRVFLCLLTHRFENTGRGDLQIIGKEAGFVAWSLASGKGFAYPFPGYDAATAWLAPVSRSVVHRFPDSFFECHFGRRVLLPNDEFGLCGVHLLADLWLGKRLYGVRVGLGASWAWVFLPFAILFRWSGPGTRVWPP